MIILDTRLISEAMKPQPHQAVKQWLDDQKAETIYITSPSIADLLVGIGSLPNGRSKDGLARALDRSLEVFSGRVLTFDTLAAWSFADLSVKAKNLPRSFGAMDLCVAAIAAAQGLPLASFEPELYDGLGIPVINPLASDQ